MSSLEGAFATFAPNLRSCGRKCHEDIQRVNGRLDLVLYGLIVTMLVPIFLRVFFH